jgi:tetratricopeptide (TPR) repeat protein
MPVQDAGNPRAFENPTGIGSKDRKNDATKADAMEEQEVEKIEVEVKKEWPAVISGVGGITALIGFCVSIGGGVTWLVNHHRNTVQRQSQVALAQTEVDQGDYQAAIQCYGAVLKDDPTYQPALDGQLNAAEHWVEDFHVSAPGGQDPSPAAGAMLDQIMPILEAGLTRAQGAQAANLEADIEAHLAWAHWRGQSTAQAALGSAGETDLRKALALDPGNAYANAMMGELTLRTTGDLTEATHSFATAVASGKARPIVRTFELGGLLDFDRKGSRAALVRVADEMRRSGEALDDDLRKRMRGFCFDPAATDHQQMTESLRAIAPDEEWLTYQWLDTKNDQDFHHGQRRFIEASLLEVSGDKAEALEKFRALSGDLKKSPGKLKDQVAAAILRLQG